MFSLLTGFFLKKKVLQSLTIAPRLRNGLRPMIDYMKDLNQRPLEYLKALKETVDKTTENGSKTFKIYPNLQTKEQFKRA